MFSAAYSTAAALLSITSPPLALLWAVPPRPDATTPYVDEVLTIAPPPARRIAGTHALIPRKLPLRSTSMVLCQPSSVVASTPGVPGHSALFTSDVRQPNFASA